MSSEVNQHAQCDEMYCFPISDGFNTQLHFAADLRFNLLKLNDYKAINREPSRTQNTLQTKWDCATKIFLRKHALIQQTQAGQSL